jgi:hypothetical protein
MSSVFVAFRTRGGTVVVGYFPTSNVPEGWKLAAEPQRDISDVMASLRCSSVDEALRVMNDHWQR